MTAVPRLTTHPPTAPRTPYTHTEHGVPRPDPYHWLGSEEPRVLDHLVSERGFYDASCLHLDSLGSALKAEMLSRLPSADESARWSRRRYTYWTRHPVNSDYAELWRLNHDSEGGSTTESESSSLFFDISQQDVGTGYLDVGLTLVSPDEDLLAYNVDTAGDEVFELRFRDLRTGTDLPETIARSYYGGAWSADSQWFFYTVHDEAYRPWQVLRHRLGTDPADDVVVLEEHDQRFELSRPGDPERPPDRDLEREPLDERGVGGRRRRRRSRRPARSGAGGTVCCTASSTRRGSTASTTRRARPAAGGHQRRGGRVPPDDGPGAARC